MPKSKPIVCIDQNFLNNFKKYAASNHTTQTALINAYLRQIPDQITRDHKTNVKELSGLLSQEIPGNDYQKYLEEKYLER